MGGVWGDRELDWVTCGCRVVVYDVMIYTSDMTSTFFCKCSRVPFVAVAECPIPFS